MMKTKVHKGLACLMSLCMVVMLLPMTALAVGTTYAVSGTVDAGTTGASVSNIAVNLYAATDTNHDTSLGSGTTNASGEYSINNEVAAGDYVVVIAASEGSYAQSTANVTVNDAAVTNANITLAALDYTLSFGSETAGGVGYTRSITVDGTQSGNLSGKYLVVAITEGTGKDAKVSAMMYALQDKDNQISYASAGATVEAWIVSSNNMPTFTEEGISCSFDAHATTATE